MNAETFNHNIELSELLRPHINRSILGLLVGKKIGEGVYSVAYICRHNGHEPQILRLFKLLPEDNLQAKAFNITKENNVLKLMRTADIGDILEASTGAKLSKIESTGPHLASGEFTFWDQPVSYTADGRDYKFVAYQILDYMPGQSLNYIQGTARANPEFIKKVGTSFGNVLACFHMAAAELTFPHYTSEEELDKHKHDYQHVKMASSYSQHAAEKDEAFAPFAEVSAMLEENLMPLFQNHKYHSSTHGNLELGNIVVENARVTGLIDWDKACKGLREYDFCGVALIPGLLEVAVDTYMERLIEARRIVRDSTNINNFKATALELSLAVSVADACTPYKNNTHLQQGIVSSQEEAHASAVVACDLLLTQLTRFDSAYYEPAAEIRRMANDWRKKYPGIEYRIG